jgi:hypothetical protein
MRVLEMTLEVPPDNSAGRHWPWVGVPWEHGVAWAVRTVSALMLLWLVASALWRAMRRR